MTDSPATAGPLPPPGLKSDSDSDPGLTTDEALSASSTPRLDPQSPSSPRYSRHGSFSGSNSSSYHDDWESVPPLDRLTVLDLLDNFALPQQLEKLQKGISAQREKVRKSRAALRSKGHEARERMVEEWRRRVPSADERLDRYRRRMKTSVDKLSRRWNDTRVITLREKVSFICATLNIFISGYLIGAHPQVFHLWWLVQLFYFMPLRYYNYHRRGMGYFLVDLCYFVNFLLFFSLFVFPSSKRLFISAYCLAFGNNAVAIIFWRNSLVFHDFDKVSTLFIHIMPCATLHCIVHLFPPEVQQARFPALWVVKNSPPGSPTAYANILSMLIWSTVPYAFWQISYYIFISIRRRDKIAAGRLTSFTWLMKSYQNHWLGKLVANRPEWLQEPTFMLIQYTYAVLTMLPCSLWFYSRWASSIFMMVIFSWSIYNGSTFYIDVFGKRFQKELEALKAEVTKWQNSPDALDTPLMTPSAGLDGDDSSKQLGEMGPKISPSGRSESFSDVVVEDPASGRQLNVNEIPLLDEKLSTKQRNYTSEEDALATGVDGGARDVARERKTGELIS